jgi:hypothetical protein
LPLDWEKNDELKDVYRNITLHPSINSATVTRVKFRTYLVKRYKGPIAAYITDLLDLTIPIKVGDYWSKIEDIINIDFERLYWLAFQIYDFG